MRRPVTAQELADDLVQQLGFVGPRKVSVAAVQRLVRQRAAHLSSGRLEPAKVDRGPREVAAACPVQDELFTAAAS